MFYVQSLYKLNELICKDPSISFSGKIIWICVLFMYFVFHD